MNASPSAVAAPIVRIRDLVKDYRRGAEVVRVLDQLSLDIQRGDFVALMGPSGSGKSTLMNLIGCLDTPSSGVYRLNGGCRRDHREGYASRSIPHQGREAPGYCPSIRERSQRLHRFRKRLPCARVSLAG